MVGLDRPGRPPGADRASTRPGGSPRCAGCADCTHDAPFTGRSAPTSRSRSTRPTRSPSCASAGAAADELRGISGDAPDRTGRSARAWRRRRSGLLVDVPAEPVGPSRSVITRQRAPTPTSAAAGHIVVRVGAHSPRPTSCWSTTRAARRLGENVEIVAGDGAHADLRRHPRMGRRRRAPGAPPRPGRPGRDGQARRADLRRRPGPDLRHRASTTARAARSSCSACTSPTPASTSSTGWSSTTPAPHCTSRVLYKGALQGKARTRSGSATC